MDEKEQYNLFKIVKRKNKEGKEYYLAIVIMSNQYDCDIVRILLKPEQVEKLNQAIKTPNFDVSKYIEVKYNTFTKAYQPSINYGL